MLEKQIKKDIKDYLEKKGFKVYILNDKFRLGIPDLIAGRNGQLIWIEVKRPGGRATALQIQECFEWNEKGIEAIIVDNLKDVKKFLNQGE